MPRHHPKEPNWRSSKHLFFRSPAAHIKPWLLDTGSLTERLIQASHGDFKVKILRQHWATPLKSETELLGMKPREQAIVREVILCCYDQPWIFARSILPARSTEGTLRHLRRWDDNSLGALLFSDPGMQRDPFEIAQLAGNHSILPASLQDEETVWGRRSRFLLGNQPLLVCEIFLPAFQPSPIVASSA